ncbi:MAG TPA: AAA family ATPase, partial [Candidatus Acidoferrum sp.]|nr:AAA family ATPase [Candidatus Acidoferrum sp.]
MLKLRKVEITGFKSFFERTTVTFSGSGTTCIVGPNGCGKSNVVDAISWVLGEQSHKSLRAGRMSDCIFNGTLKRPPLGLAEVTITMEDPELAEAARFVLDSVEAADVSSPVPATSGEAQYEGSIELGAGELGGEIVSLDPAAGLVTDGPQPVAEAMVSDPESGNAQEFLKSKRRKKGSDKLTLATKPGEVVVSRRLYRSGQSEYLINGRAARLRDIQDMFMGVGLGPDSYAIIEQGRIG